MGENVWDEFMRIRNETRELVRAYKVREKLKAIQLREEVTEKEEKKRVYPFGVYGYGTTALSGGYGGFPYSMPYSLG
jgi:hypothetical protein